MAPRIFLFFLIALLSWPIHGQSKSITSGQIAQLNQTQIKPATNFSAKSIDGQLIQLSQFKGKVILLNYWATWCPPCIAEIPDLIALQKRYGNSLQIIGISMDDDSADAIAFAKKNKINYPIVMKTPKLESQFTTISAIPTTIVISKEQMIVQIETGYRSKSFFEGLIKRLSK